MRYITHKTVFSLFFILAGIAGTNHLLQAGTDSLIEMGGTTYYMRADGKASNKAVATSCSSATTAMSVEKHNKEKFLPDDIIELCEDGGVYKTSIIAPSSGSDGHPVIYKNADGDTPTIDLSMDVGSTGWKDMGNGIYRKKGYGRVLWEDDVPLKAATSVDLSDGEWFYPNGSHKLYYKPSSGTPADHSIRTMWFDAGWSPYAIDLRNRSNITVQGMTITRTGGGIGHGQNKKSPVSLIKNINIHDNKISKCMWAIWSEVFNNGVESDVRIYDNTISYCNSGISAWTDSDTKPGHTQHHIRYAVTGNQILNLNSITPDIIWSNALLHFWYYTDHEAISFQDVQDSVISGNTITTTFSQDMTSDAYWCRAVYFYLTNGAPTTGNIVVRNNISGHFYPAIYISTGKNFTGFENNTIAYNLIRYDQSDAGQISFGMNVETDNPMAGINYFVNNTVVNAVEGLGIQISKKMVGKWIIRNNIIKSPSIVVVSDTNDVGNLAFDHNLYPAASSGFLIGTSGMKFTNWKNRYDTLGSSAADPDFVSPGKNFHLQSSSPAVDAGKFIEILRSIDISKDLDGHPISGNPDIGAYEFQPVSK